jgi:hypothetical protein
LEPLILAAFFDVHYVSDMFPIAIGMQKEINIHLTDFWSFLYLVCYVFSALSLIQLVAIMPQNFEKQKQRL